MGSNSKLEISDGKEEESEGKIKNPFRFKAEEMEDESEEEKEEEKKDNSSSATPVRSNNKKSSGFQSSNFDEDVSFNLCMKGNDLKQRNDVFRGNGRNVSQIYQISTIKESIIS